LENIQKNYEFSFEYTFTLDSKGRVSVPANYREDLGEQFAVCRCIGKPNVIAFYPLPIWEELSNKLTNPNVRGMKELRSYVYRSKLNLTADSDGRVILPKELLNLVGFGYGSKTSVTFVGNYNYVQLWKTSDWDIERPKELDADLQEEIVFEGDISSFI
jgi:MraZ protein